METQDRLSSQRSEAGQGILFAKEDVGKYMTCGMVWYVRMSCRLACRPSSPLEEVPARWLPVLREFIITGKARAKENIYKWVSA
jgi:hypothetical protein